MRNLLPCSLNELELMPVAGVTQGEFLKPHFPLLPLNKYQLTSTSVVHATSRLPQGTLGSPTSLNHLMVHSISSDLQDRPLLDMARGLNWAEKKCSWLIKQNASTTATALCDVHECNYGVSVHLASNSFPAFFLVRRLSCLRRDWLGIMVSKFCSPLGYDSAIPWCIL